MGKKGGKKKNASNVFSMFEPSQIQGIVHKLIAVSPIIFVENH